MKFVSSVCVYIAGLFIGSALFVLRLFRIWKVTGMENLPTLREKGNRGIVIVSNHPSLLEPIILPGIFAHWYFFDMKYGPWNMAETGNFKRGLFRLLEERIIFVDRKSQTSKAHGFLQAKILLESGTIVLIFPEGGRTCSGKLGRFLVDSNSSGTEENKPKIRPFTKGAAMLAIQTQAIVVPIWVEGTDKVSPNGKAARYPFPRFWRKVNVAIGRPIVFPADVSAETATHELEKAVLGLTHVARCAH